MLNNKNDFDYASLEHLKNTHSAVKLLSAVNAPLILGFLHQVFIQGNRASITQTDIISKLSDYLYLIKSAYGEDKYPSTPAKYLDDWVTGVKRQGYFPVPAPSLFASLAINGFPVSS